LDLAVADAGRANTNAPRGAFYQRADLLKIDVPAALGDVVGVAYLVTELRAPTANFANSCHLFDSTS
jgi:hypothetical protein